MIKEKVFDEVPAFAIVRERIRAITPNVEIVKAQFDENDTNYVIHLQLTRSTTLRLSDELLKDLPCKNADHRHAQLNLKICSAIDRMKQSTHS
jgi:G3E family GTPase